MSITIRLKRDGPYLIDVSQAADVVLLDADGNVLVPEAGRPIKLCRCGGSSTKPFCDGTHRHNGFVGTPEPGRTSAAPRREDGADSAPGGSP